jgi:hypothetical protein
MRRAAAKAWRHGFVTLASILSRIDDSAVLSK